MMLRTFNRHRHDDPQTCNDWERETYVHARLPLTLHITGMGRTYTRSRIIIFPRLRRHADIRMVSCAYFSRRCTLWTTACAIDPNFQTEYTIYITSMTYTTLCSYADGSWNRLVSGTWFTVARRKARNFFR